MAVTFISDISQRGSELSKSFAVSAAFSQETRESQGFITVDVSNFSLAALPYFQQTNFSAFEVTCSLDNAELTFLIPVFCVSGRENVRMELIPV